MLLRGALVVAQIGDVYQIRYPQGYQSLTHKLFAPLRLELAGENVGIELILNGLVQLGPIGEVRLVDSGFRINGDGLIVRFDLSLDAGFGEDVGLSISASAFLAINTTGRQQTFGGSTVEPGFRLTIKGNIEFLGFAKASGFLDIEIGDNGFRLEFGVNFELGGLTFRAEGGAAVVGGDDPGFALRLAIEVKADVEIFSIEASGTFELNTTGRELVGVAANSFLLDLSGKVNILEVLKFDAGLRVQVQNDEWEFNAFAELDFFGIATLEGNVFLDSKGNFDIGIKGRVALGNDDLGIVGEFNFNITSISSFDDIGNPYYVFHLNASATVEAKLFGITLVGFGLDFDVRAEGQGRTPIIAEVEAEVTFIFTFTVSAEFTLGYLELPRPVYLAGVANPATALGGRDWKGLGTDPDKPIAPQELHLNVGAREVVTPSASESTRNIGLGNVNEQYRIEQLEPPVELPASSIGATIRVSSFVSGCASGMSPSFCSRIWRPSLFPY